MTLDDTCICIPTNRTHIETLIRFDIPENMKVFLICDPKVFAHHQTRYSPFSQVSVRLGATGMSAQSAKCYEIAAMFDYKYYFRMDDDLTEDTFVAKDGHDLTLEEVIIAARQCIDETKTTLAGFANTTNKYWMGEGFGRTYGLIHGGAHICVSSSTPEHYIDVSIDTGSVHYEDVYRSLRHRELDGAVGRVKFIGLDKSGSTKSAVLKTENAADREACIQKILKRFPGMVTCDGVKYIQNGTVGIANWRYKRNPK